MKFRILVVEDDDTLRQVLDETLSLRGFDVLAADTAAGALELAGRHEVDAVLTDLDIGGMSGLEFCRSFSRQNGALGRQIPIWIMTGTDDPDLLRPAKAAGAYGLLQKPFTIQSVCECLSGSLQPAARSKPVEPVQ